MHAFILQIGKAILDFFSTINTAVLVDSLSIMLTGMIGIFIVTGLIICVVYLLNKIKS